MVLHERTDPVILGHLLAQHRDLHEFLTAARSAFSVGRREAHAALCGLRAHLAAHFLQEEQGGFLEESIARMPRLAAAAAGVVREHPRLLAELDGLIERVAVADIPPAAWALAGRDFAGFCTHLLAHERNENAVVQEGYNEDLGLE